MNIKLLDVQDWLADVVYGEDRKEALNFTELVLGWKATAVIRFDTYRNTHSAAQLVESAQSRTAVLHTRKAVLFEDADDALQVYLKWC